MKKKKKLRKFNFKIRQVLTYHNGVCLSFRNGLTNLTRLHLSHHGKSATRFSGVYLRSLSGNASIMHRVLYTRLGSRKNRLIKKLRRRGSSARESFMSTRDRARPLGCRRRFSTCSRKTKEREREIWSQLESKVRGESATDWNTASFSNTTTDICTPRNI